MECPACQTNCRPGQKFCDACGHNLETECPSCGTANPPDRSFCSRCGQSLAAAGTVVLVRSGLIADIDEKAAALLGHEKEGMAGKPFSLFVVREDLPVFFSHWNELINSSERQTAELALRHKSGQKIYVMIQWQRRDPSGEPKLFHLSLSPTGNHRSALDRLQHQQDLLNLIYLLADSVRTASDHHQAESIVQGLKRICLFLKADTCFICIIDRRLKRLQTSFQWSQPAGPDEKGIAETVPLAAIKRSVARLRRERAYIVADVSKLPLAERTALLTAFHAPPASLMGQLIYTHKHPIAIIGVVRNQASGEWDPDGAALIKLFGQLVCDLPALNPAKKPQAPAEPAPRDGRGKGGASSATENNGAARNTTNQPARPWKMNQEGTKTSAQKPHRDEVKPLPRLGEPMKLDKMEGIQSIARQRVFVREDGLVLLTCPHCGQQESVTTARFETLGNAITVLCACRKRFAAVLEKRRSVRKAVRLEGFFSVAGDHGVDDPKASIWGPMVVKSLSKSGLRFSSPRANLVYPEDLLMVRFNLNNSNNALIHKKARVVSIQKNEVGCRFEGADEYDITLGFYFM